MTSITVMPNPAVLEEEVDNYMPAYNIIRGVNEFVLPPVSKKYSMLHMCDKPFMFYPNEQATLICDNNIILTSYGRCYNIKKNSFYNDGKPIVKNEFSTTIKNKKYKIKPPTLISTLWPNSPYILNKTYKKPISIDERNAFRQWYDLHKEELDELAAIDVTQLYFTDSGLYVHPQTVWLHRHPQQRMKDNQYKQTHKHYRDGDSMNE